MVAGQRRIDHARDRNVGQAGLREQTVDAGAKREDRAKVRIAGELARRRLPDQSDIDLGRIADLRPDPEVELRDPGEQRRAPRLGRVVRAEEHQGHDPSRAGISGAGTVPCQG